MADFYWPQSDTEISFELRNSVQPDTISTYEELVAGIENDTHVDCRVAGDGEAKDFQIKRYPLAHLGDTNEAFLEWFENSVLDHYGEMTGTTLVVILQPDGRPEQFPLNLAELAESIAGMADRITFDEVVFAPEAGPPEVFTIISKLIHQCSLKFCVCDTIFLIRSKIIPK